MSLDMKLKHCPKCGEWKHRQRFVPKGSSGRYESLCVTCRHKYDLAELPKQLRIKKMEKGLVTSRRFGVAERSIAESKKRAYEDRIKPGVALANARTWERPTKSAKAALRLLAAYPFDTPEKAQWQDRVKALVVEALKEIKEQKTEKPLLDSKILFWYDVKNGMKWDLQQIIKEWPDGQGVSPMQVL